ncbi:ABC transporter permease [Paraclostridium ghonii]|uniref:Peptide/nickel transport system permease protein n=1 Tax=Paraclostridium ghonii TaxID=29358 RepID=A0ABU0MZE5_9FIRM|nr:ABC transporter permease [Paeniclostridium ghonii]MDQ0556241.1 peptide/nickel transport system permease protein [Paeniclostridium ghonii]
MVKFILKKIIYAMPIIVIVSILSFMIIYASPGDPVNMYIKPEMSQADIRNLKVELGLDGNVVYQYIGWLKNILKGDLGNSLINHRSVSEQIIEKILPTISLMGISLILSLCVSIPLGLISGLNKNKFIDNFISITSYIGISIPGFWLGIMLISLFSLELGILPSSGMRTLGVDSSLDLIKHFIMPVIALSIGNIAVFTRYIRINTINQLEEEYVITARAKGASEYRILFKHILKNCLIPIITIAGMNLSNLVTGSFIIESVFGWPGMGTLGMNAINSRDYPMIMAFTMLACIVLIIGNLIADVLYVFADPRIKGEAKL